MILFFEIIGIYLLGIHDVFRRYFYLVPLMSFVGLLLLFIALILYASQSIINGISARLMITSIALAYTSLAIVSLIAGRYSVIYQKNSADYYYTKAENIKKLRSIEEQ